VRSSKARWSASFILLVAITFCLGICNTGLNNGVTLCGDGVGMAAAESGLLVTAFMASSSVVRLVSGKVTDDRAPKVVLIAGLAILSIGCIASVCSQSYPLLLIARVVQGAGSPYLNAEAFRRCPSSRWGVASSNLHLSGDFGVAAGALVCGIGIDVFGYVAVPVAVATALLVSTVVSIVAFPRLA